MLNLIEKNTQIKKDVLIENFLVFKNHNPSGEKQGVYNASKVSDRQKQGWRTNKDRSIPISKVRDSHKLQRARKTNQLNEVIR